jgi:hypothetical protein
VAKQSIEEAIVTSDEVRRIIRQELKGEGIAIEFADLARVETGDSGESAEVDCAHERPMYSQDDDFEKFFQAGHDGQELQKRDVARSRMAPARQETEPELSVEEFFGECTKRSSDPYKIKLTKRLIAGGEILVEGWDASGTCVMTRVVAAGEDISEGEPLAKAAITSSMQKTLAQFRASLLPEEVKACEKAIASLDLPAFLAIIDRAKTAA